MIDLIIKIDPEFKKLIPPLRGDEYKQLEANILADGCRDPLVLWDDTLIDGHNRHEICTKNSVAFKTEQYHFNTRDDVKLWIIQNQCGRRNLAPYQSTELALIAKPILEAKAKERQATSTGGANPQLMKNSSKAEKPVNTRKEIAKMAGVSENTVDRVEYIQNHGTQQQIERARVGGKGNSVNAVFNEIREQEAAVEGGSVRRCIKCGKVKALESFEPNKNKCRTCKNGEDVERKRGIVKKSAVREHPKSRPWLSGGREAAFPVDNRRPSAGVRGVDTVPVVINKNIPEYDGLDLSHG